MTRAIRSTSEAGISPGIESMGVEAMIVWIGTDMEGLAGVDSWDQCYDPDDDSAVYRHGREQLTADTNAAIAGCFDAGATEVRVQDGHGRNRNRGFILEKLDPRARLVGSASHAPLRSELLDETVHAVAMIGQHSMAGTLHGFIDHTQCPKTICRFKINGDEYGEMGQFALYAGHFGIPLVYVSGDEALCAEARRQFPHAVSTPTKKGTGWATCELYPTDTVRSGIRADIARSLTGVDRSRAWSTGTPIEIRVEWAWSELADICCAVPGVERIDARTARWYIDSQLDVYSWPSADWQPMHGKGTN